MAKKGSKNKISKKKKTSIGQGKFSKFGSSGGGPRGSTVSPMRRNGRKPYRGQGR